MALAVVDVGLDERREVIECLLTFFLQYLLASDEVVALCQGAWGYSLSHAAIVRARVDGQDASC